MSYHAVVVVVQRRQLPKDLSDTLPFTHQVKLLSFKSDQEKIELGRRALQEDLSSRAPAEEVKRLKVREPTAPQVGSLRTGDSEALLISRLSRRPFMLPIPLN